MRRRTTNEYAVRELARTHRVNTRNGYVYNEEGRIVGSNCTEPKISVRVDTPDGRKKYGVRTAKLIAYVRYGADALKNNVEVRHIDGNKFNNAASNLILVHKPAGDLTRSQIRRIRTLVNRGENTTTITERTGASRHQVRRIANGAYSSVQ